MTYLSPHEQEGLYRKYEVQRLRDPEGKHDDCTYFVLDPRHDRFAVPALRAYATACRAAGLDILADDLERMADDGAAAAAGTGTQV